jgi:hypothetical protein
MSIDQVHHEMKRFLESKDPEVICIRGSWGVGKTYAWNNRLGDAHRDGRIGLERYSYVSLFGLNSLDEMKAAIFENVVILKNGKLKADLGTLDAFVSNNIGSWRKITRFGQNLPIVKSVLGGEAGQALSFLSIRNQIVCLDDLERRGQKLEVSDILGLCSFLREQRDCKVVLLLNDEQLNEAKKEFERYLEKVVDVSLSYQPTSAESVQVARLWKQPISERCAELALALGVSNIRVIRKMNQALGLLKPILAELDPEVLKPTSASLALFVWSYYQPDQAPTLDFLVNKKAKSLYGLGDRENISPEEAKWNALLASYGYEWTDDLDLELISGVRNGYFDAAKILKSAKELEQQILANRADGSFSQAWRAYHDSFDADQDTVLDGLYAAFMKSAEHVSPSNLDGTVRLFKELGRNEQAAEMIAHYVDKRGNDRKLFDLTEHAFEPVRDEDIKAVFEQKLEELRRPVDLRDILVSIKDGWDDGSLTVASGASIEDYKKAFKGEQGEQLRKMISGALQFRRIVNASPQMVKISELATQALTSIGGESAINARRVERYGIKIEKPVKGGV